jgi:membrane protein YqaA with SNARE-associated domain
VFWPLMPEAILVPLAAARPRQWLQLAGAAVLGSATGTALSYAIGRAGHADRLLEHLPLVRPAMVRAARTWLSDEGGLGLRHQPLTGLPVKVFALVAPSSGVSLPAFLVCAAAARGSRFVVVCAGAALVGNVLRSPLERWPKVFLVGWCVAFAVGLRRTVGVWERRDTAQP